MSEAQAWAQSVEKARLALTKTFEGRVEAALASIEQIPLGQGRKAGGSKTLAQFALDAGIEYDTLGQYREITNWLGKTDNGRDFSEDTARYRVGDISVYSLAREGLKAGKWKSGTLFATFLDANDPPEPFARWTVDALRVHLGQKPTNTGKLALKEAAGEKVTDDEKHAAAAKDHAAKAADEVDQIKNNLAKAVAAMESEQVIHEAAPVTGEFDMDRRAVEDMFGPLSRTHQLAREYATAVDASAEWLAKHGNEIVGGDTSDPDDRPEKIADIARDAFAEDLGIITTALAKVGVGVSLEEGLNTLLNG